MAAKSLGTPNVMASPEVSRHTMGSNHIWKTSSGKSALKSHLTVSQRLGVRDEEGMNGQKYRNYSHCGCTGSPTCLSCLILLPLTAPKIHVQPSTKRGYEED